MRFFESFTIEELQRYKEVFGEKFEYATLERCVILNLPNEYIKLYKRNGAVYVLCEESEGMYEEREDGTIYYLDPEWWYKIDIEKLIADYTNGIEIDTNEYRI